jgi:predicted DNA-binding transcriptional regulator YafY
MHRNDRLMAIVLMLRARKRVTAGQLAQMFSVTERTIYRDMQSLMDTDVPIAATPGLEGGYELQDGFYQHPVMLSKDEAVSLFLGGAFIADRRGTPFRDSVVTALEKLRPLLPEDAREPVTVIRDHVRWDVPDALPTGSHAGNLQTLIESMQEHKRTRIVYVSGEETTERVISPYGFVYGNGAWYVVGFCDLRDDVRRFRVERIEQADLTNESYQLPDDIDLDQYAGERWAQGLEIRLRDTAPAVVIRATPIILAEIDKHWFHRYATRSPLPDTDDQQVTLHDYDEDAVVRLVRSWGPDVEVISPKSLREQLRAEGELLARKYISNPRVAS